MELKEVEYKGFYPGANGRVAYVCHGYFVFFSGLTLPRVSTSTINAAEAVVEAICQAEGLDWSKYSFYDLQTAQGYYKVPGDSNLDKLTVFEAEGKIHVYGWMPTGMDIVPDEVLEVLTPLIV